MSAAIALDSSGLLHAATDLSGMPPEAIATAVCGAVDQLMGVEASVVSASVLGEPPRAFGLAMLRVHPGGMFRSGSASASDPSNAVVGAVLAALGLEEGIFAATAARWREATGVRAVNVIESGSSPATDTETSADVLQKLTQAMPAPGRLAVLTADTEYRVLRFPAAALAVSTTPDAATLEQIDAWMAAAEALGP